MWLWRFIISLNHDRSIIHYVIILLNFWIRKIKSCKVRIFLILFNYFIDRNLVRILFLFPDGIFRIMFFTKLMFFWKTYKSRRLRMAGYVNMHEIRDTILPINAKIFNIIWGLVFLRHTYRLILILLIFRWCLFIIRTLRKVWICKISLINDIKFTILHTAIDSITVVSVDIYIVKIIYFWR